MFQWIAPFYSLSRHSCSTNLLTTFEIWVSVTVFIGNDVTFPNWLIGLLLNPCPACILDELYQEKFLTHPCYDLGPMDMTTRLVLQMKRGFESRVQYELRNDRRSYDQELVRPSTALLCGTSSPVLGEPRTRILRFLRTVVLSFVVLVDCSLATWAKSASCVKIELAIWSARSTKPRSKIILGTIERFETLRWNLWQHRGFKNFLSTSFCSRGRRIQHAGNRVKRLIEKFENLKNKIR